MSSAIHARHMRRGLVAFLMVVAAGLLASPARASNEAHLWSYQLNGVRCYFDNTYGLSVLATAPLQNPNGNVTSWYGGRETVYWRSQLQQYVAGRWRIVNNRFPWLKGVANAAGILPFGLGAVYYWVNSRTNNLLEHHEYRGLGHGSYRVKEYFYWPASKQTRWSYAHHYNQQYLSYCPL